MANKIITVLNNRAGSVNLDTVNGLIALAPTATVSVEVTAAQLTRIQAVSNLVVTGTSADTATSTLGLVLEEDLNVDVFDQEKLVTNFGAIDTFASLVSKAMSGDMVFVISPTTVDREATAEAFTRTVTITLKTAAGAVHTWFNGDLAVAVSDNSTAGEATITDATPPMVAGVCTVVVSGSAAAWVAEEHNTLTLSNKTILGYTVTGGTSVETIVAAE